MATSITSAARRACFAISSRSKCGKGCPCLRTRRRAQLRALADGAGTVWRTLQPADRVSFGEVDLVVHHPPRPEWERQRVRNDDSEVLEIRYGGVSFVFTGDIGREVERTIAPSFARAPIRILKVPHHGSATSSSQPFLDALQPDIAVISAGRGNPFGHPVPSVLERYRNIGAAIYQHRSGWGGDSGDRWHDREGEDVHRADTNADDAREINGDGNNTMTR